MPYDPINRGQAAGDGTGEPLFGAFGKINAMLLEVYNLLAGLATHVHAAATTTVAGFLSAADKNKLDGIAPGASANQTDAFLRARANHTGTQPTSTVDGLDTALAGKAASAHTHAYADVTGKPATFAPSAHTHLWADTIDKPATFPPEAHIHADAVAGGASGFMSGAEKTKLAGVAAGATANATDALLRDRTTHTGAQAISTVTGLQAALDAKAATGHAHAIADTTGLQAALDAKAATAHAHADATTSAAGFMAAADKTKLNGVATGATANSTDAQLRDRSTHTGTQPQASVDGLPSALAAKVNSIVGASGGSAVTNIIALMQAQFDALAPKDSATLYVVTGA